MLPFCILQGGGKAHFISIQFTNLFPWVCTVSVVELCRPTILYNPTQLMIYPSLARNSCDPHEANVLLREHPAKKGKPQIVLVDHGLYKTLDGDFQDSYARLWKGIVMANIDEIKSACEQLGVRDMYPLLSGNSTSLQYS